jgi:two-component system, NarL family, response regulator LiaR
MTAPAARARRPPPHPGLRLRRRHTFAPNCENERAFRPRASIGRVRVEGHAARWQWADGQRLALPRAIRRTWTSMTLAVGGFYCSRPSPINEGAARVSRRGTIRTLIADVQLLFAETVRQALEIRGIEVVGTTTRGREAVRLARTENPDSALIDLGLRDIDGLMAGRRILAERPEIKLVALASLVDAALVREAIRAGFQGYVMKENSLEELMSSLKAVARTQAVIPYQAAQALAGMRTEEQEAALLARTLTVRERQVLSLLQEGASSHDLAERLYLSPNTVRTHIQRICGKLLVHSRLEAVAFANRYQIVG